MASLTEMIRDRGQEPDPPKATSSGKYILVAIFAGVAAWAAIGVIVKGWHW